MTIFLMYFRMTVNLIFDTNSLKETYINKILNFEELSVLKIGLLFV